MSYPIIYQNKFIDLGNGRIVKALRMGCNNDTEGRERNFYNNIEVQNREYALLYAENCIADVCEDWCIRVGSKYMTHKQYGTWLKKKILSAIPVEEFERDYFYNSYRYTGIIDFETGEHVKSEDFQKWFDAHPYGATYRRVWDCPTIEDAEDGDEFFIKKKNTKN